DDKGWDARKRAYCLKIQPATGSFARNLIYSTKPNLPSGDSALDNFAEGSGNSTKFPLIFITLTISFSAFTNLTGTGAGLSNR
ncbi:hypothetical protein ACRW7I_22490, partial [Escherichia coli]